MPVYPGAFVAVGTALAGGPPHRSRRAELPHRAPASGPGVEARVWVGMRDAGSREPSVLVPVHPLPGHRGALAAAPQRLVPVPGYLAAEGRYRPEVPGHRVVRHVPAYHAGQPAALYRYGLVHAFPELFFDPAQRGPQPFRDGGALYLEPPAPGPPAEMGEPQERERLRLAQPPGRPVRGGEPPELDQPGLLRVQLQPEPRHPLAKIVQE